MRLRLCSLGFTLLNFLPVLSQQYTKDSYSGRMTADGIPIEELPTAYDIIRMELGKEVADASGYKPWAEGGGWHGDQPPHSVERALKDEGDFRRPLPQDRNLCGWSNVWNAERRQFELDDCYTLIIRDRDLSEGIKHLSVPLRYNDDIHTIDLSRTNLGDRGAGIIAELIKINPHIEGLHLAENNITANGTARIARALRRNPRLAHLHIEGNPIGDDGAQSLAIALRNNSELETLIMHMTSVGDTGAEYIAESLRVNKKLKKLHLGLNFIGNEGARALAEAMRQNFRLRELDLEYNDIEHYEDLYWGYLNETSQGRVKRFKLDREPKHDDEEPDFPELDDDAWRFSQRNMQADDETFDDDHEFQRDRHKAIPNKVDSAGNAPKTYGFTVGDGLATGEVVGGLKT